jgi:peptidoglycan L-alanyl-D-glutamate endopeptidase CwlK
MTRKAILALIETLKAKVVALRAQLPKEDLLPAVKRKRDALVTLCASHGVPIRVTSGFRSFAEQDALYAQGRTKPGQIVTKAQGGQSLHNYGVAFDVWPTGVQDWDTIGKCGESLGLEWGGRWTSFVDKPHFQLMFGYTLQDFQNKKVDISKYN